MDHPSYCAGSCKDPAVQTANGMWLCQGCGLSLETRKARQRKVVIPYTAASGRRASMSQHPAGTRWPEPVEPIRRPQPAPEVQTQPCTTCEKGRVGVARWEAGTRSCTDCEPLWLVAVSPNKAAEVFELELSPEQVKSVRRRS